MTLERWEQKTEWSLAGCAAVFMACYAWLVLEPKMPSALRNILTVLQYLTWALFGVDYIVRVTLAHNRGRYVVRNALDLLILTLPFLRPLRLLRLVILMKAINRKATTALRGRVIVYVVGGSVIVVVSAALAVLDAERGAVGATITTFGDALWWAVTTITTVGYGDQYPVTTEGRFVAVGLMLAGIALLGIITASFASWLVERVREVETDMAAVTHADIEALRAEVARLSAHPDSLSEGTTDGPTQASPEPIG